MYYGERQKILLRASRTASRDKLEVLEHLLREGADVFQKDRYMV